MHLLTELPQDTAVDRCRLLVGASPIFAKLAEALRVSTDGSVRAVEEFWIPASHERADLVLVNGSLAAFEIKSARDRLDRLPRQVSAFSRIFDYSTLVVAERHYERASAEVPDWWGLMIVSDREPLVIEEIRGARRNRALDVDLLVRLLWREEVEAILSARDCVRVRGASRARLWRLLLETTRPDDLARLVRETLLRRRNEKARIGSRRFRAVLPLSTPEVP
jgi:hypothetical protein